MSKAVTKQDEKKAEIAIAMDPAEWGAAPISSKDIIIPRILLMQPMSDKVTAGEAAFGEFRESLNNTRLGDFKTPFEIIPFHMEKVFIEYKIVTQGQKTTKEFLRVVPITPANEDAKYEDTEVGEDGKVYPIARDYTMNFYLLLASELRSGEGAMPYILSTRRTSSKAGKKLATQMYVKNLQAKKTPASTMCLVTAGKQTNDEGTWAVIDVLPGEPTPDTYVAEALKWYKMVKAGQAKAHVESFAETEAPIRDVSAQVDVETGPSNF